MDQHENYINSIGKIGQPIYDEHNNRVKGFSTNIVESVYDVSDFIEKARNVRDRNNATRLGVRFVIRNENLSNKNTPLFNGFETEYIPLSGNWEGYGLQYFGENDEKRLEPKHVRDQENVIVSESIKTATPRNPLERYSNNYITEIGIRNDDDIRQIYQLYNLVYRDYVFRLTEDNVAELVENPISIPVVSRNSSGNIVSVAIAEVAEIPTNNGLLRISEISDEATHPENRGNGLNQKCVYVATQELLNRYNGDVHLIYEEDRATSRGVNQQSANLGFRFAGRLNRACKIDADRDIEVEGPYEDLNVWYLQRR